MLEWFGRKLWILMGYVALSCLGFIASPFFIIGLVGKACGLKLSYDDDGKDAIQQTLPQYTEAGARRY